MSKQQPDYTSAYQRDDQDTDLSDELYGTLDELLPTVNQALAVQGDGTIQVGRFTLTRIGFQQALSVTRAEWGELGDFLTRLNGSLQWLIGDWLVYGEEHFKFGRAELAAMVDRDLHSFDNYAWVARSLPYSLRRESLTFGHHMLVAGFDDEKDKVYWLDRALANQWSIAQMRKAIAGIPEKSDPMERELDNLLQRGIRLGESDQRRYVEVLRQAADQLERGWEK